MLKQTQRIDEQKISFSQIEQIRIRTEGAIGTNVR
jgi:hypothetical protein